MCDVVASYPCSIDSIVNNDIHVFLAALQVDEMVWSTSSMFLRVVDK